MCLVFFGIMRKYEICEGIGSGSFGVAKLVRERWTKELFAVKFIERGQKVYALGEFCWFFFHLGFFFVRFDKKKMSLRSFEFGGRLMNMCSGRL